MNKKHMRFLSLLICLIVAVGVSAGCRKKAKKTEAPTTTTTAAVTEDTKATEAPVTTESASAETTEKTDPTTTEAPTTTTEETTTEAPTTTEETTEAPTEAAIDEDGEYTSKDDVALYIHTYGHLPKNFVTKSEAREKGWEGGSLEEYFPGCSIGGDSFGNREGILPSKNGRKYTECDIDTKGKKSRGAKRIVFSNDGLIYYTDDHYETFTLLYGEE